MPSLPSAQRAAGLPTEPLEFSFRLHVSTLPDIVFSHGGRHLKNPSSTLLYLCQHMRFRVYRVYKAAAFHRLNSPVLPWTPDQSNDCLKTVYPPIYSPLYSSPPWTF